MSEVGYNPNIELPPLPEGPEAGLASPQFGSTPHERPAQQTDGTPQFFHRARKTGDGKYENVEFMKILTPGDNKATPEHKVTDALRQKYAWHYDRWRRGLEVSRDGVPLEMFPTLTPAQVMSLKALNIFTVEDLAAVSDANLHRIPMGITLRQNAATWLKSKQETDVIERQGAALKAAQDGQRMLEQQIRELSERLSAAETQKPQQSDALSDAISQAADSASDTTAEPGKRGPGRPRKE